jgi:MFS family permease
VRLWLGLTISHFGTAVGSIALPLTAIAHLGAGAREMGLLVALTQLPVPLFGLFAGVWLDRVRRRPLMLAADVGRAAILATVPLAALTDTLHLGQLYVVAFAVGTLKVIFDLGSTSYLPTLVKRGQLFAANANLQMTDRVAAVAGSGLGGGLVQWLGAPLAVAVDAASFLGSALCLSRIRTAEEPAPVDADVGIARQIGAGVRAAFGQPVISAMIVTSTLGSFAGALQQAVLLLFMTELGLSPGTIGGLFAVAAAAAWCGAALAAPAAARFGPGSVLVGASFLMAAAAALVPLAGLGAPPAVVVLAVAQSAGGLALILYSVTQISLRQALTPDALLGRVNATRRVFVFGAIPVGAVVGGALGESFGLRSALICDAAVALVAALYALVSPLRTARAVPTD